MATIGEPRDLFVTELRSLLYVEQKLAEKVLPELHREIASDDLREGIQQHLDETKRHVANLERAFELLGEEPKPDKSHAIDGLVAQHEKVAKHIEPGRLRDLFDAGAAAKTEHLEIAAYEGMITCAEALGEDEIVSLLEENLDDEKKALKTVDEALEQLAKQSAVV